MFVQASALSVLALLDPQSHWIQKVILRLVWNNQSAPSFPVFFDENKFAIESTNQARSQKKLVFLFEWSNSELWTLLGWLRLFVCLTESPMRPLGSSLLRVLALISMFLLACNKWALCRWLSKESWFWETIEAEHSGQRRFSREPHWHVKLLSSCVSERLTFERSHIDCWRAGIGVSSFRVCCVFLIVCFGHLRWHVQTPVVVLWLAAVAS